MSTLRTLPPEDLRTLLGQGLGQGVFGQDFPLLFFFYYYYFILPFKLLQTNTANIVSEYQTSLVRNYYFSSEITFFSPFFTHYFPFPNLNLLMYIYMCICI